MMPIIAWRACGRIEGLAQIGIVASARGASGMKVGYFPQPKR
jgi:hypothetical protein